MSCFTLWRMMNILQESRRIIVLRKWKHWDLSLVSRYYVRRGLRVRGQGQPPMWSGGRGWSPPASSTLSYSTGNLQSRVYIHISYGSDSFSERTETVEAGCLQGEHLFMTILPFGKGRVLPFPALPCASGCQVRSSVRRKFLRSLASGEWWVGAPHMVTGSQHIGTHQSELTQCWQI